MASSSPRAGSRNFIKQLMQMSPAERKAFRASTPRKPKVKITKEMAAYADGLVSQCMSYTQISQQNPGLGRMALKTAVTNLRHEKKARNFKGKRGKGFQAQGGARRSTAGTQEPMIFQAETTDGKVLHIAAKSGNAALKVARGTGKFKRMLGRAA